jgi:hypothetical protein
MDRPGDYVPDATEGIMRVEDLPPPHIEHRRRNCRHRACPRCGCSASRCDVASRTLHDLGNARTGRPIDLVVTYAKYRCPRCRPDPGSGRRPRALAPPGAAPPRATRMRLRSEPIDDRWPRDTFTDKSTPTAPSLALLPVLVVWELLFSPWTCRRCGSARWSWG